MKRILFFLLVVITAQLVHAQSVGIGTTTPSPSAQLDVTSTTKGMLIPRMTGAQRTAIASPAIGLLVIQTNSEVAPPSSPGLYLYELSGPGGAWKRIARSDEISSGTSTWTVSGSDQYSNVSGNVGIGTGVPTSKFHLVGNLLQESGTLTINNSFPTLQFQTAGVNKGFLQTTGGDNSILIGTSSGNTAGKFIVRLNGISSLVVEPNGNAGIGTASPDASAKLDITSTTGGLLIPRMTLAQRISIASPATGLIVYDTDLDEFSYYDGTGWQRLLNGNYDYWNKSSSRHWVYNISDSIGLGTSSPTERLDVNGNIHGRDNITADGYISATGAVQGGALVSTGTLLALGNGVIGGDLQINSDLIINNTSAIMQLKSSNVNKGFYQLVGDNVRFGTNNGNTGGDVILRMDGDDVINFHKTSLGAAVMQMNSNGASAGVLQVSPIGSGSVSLTATNSNGLVQLGGEVNINSTTNSTGIGTVNPLSKLHILNGGDASLTSNGYLMMGPVTGTNLILDNNEIMVRNAGGTSSLVLQNDGGSVRIGNVPVPSGYKFAINGKMICEELKVKLASSGWPDYVFDKKYILPALGEVEKFIQAHQHLPHMPSAAEVEKNGIEVGDMQKRMMEKIEELTLYIIELKKEIDSLKEKK